MASNDEGLRVLLIVIGLIVLLPFLMMVVAWPMMGMWGGGHRWGADPGAIWFMLLMWLIPLAVIVAVGYLLYRGLADRDDGSSDPALEELRLAYARGDLTEDEFETRHQRLRDEE